MLHEVEAAEHPDVKDGEEIAGDIRTVLASMKGAFVQARAKAAALPDDGEGFIRGAKEISQDIAAVAGSAPSHLDDLGEKYDAPELGSAFKNEPACE
jgi:hypothetical protein